MLLNFSVSNFRSFKEEQTFSMVASGRHQDHPEHTIAIPGNEHRLLPVAALYGANGAGKSNLVKALEFLKELVLTGRKQDEAMHRQHFLLDRASSRNPTEFSIQFIEGQKVYSFGCSLNTQHVEKEWLNILEEGKEHTIYQRTTSAKEVKVETGDTLSMVSPDDRKGKVLTEEETKHFAASNKLESLAKVGALPNQLFLNTVAVSLSEQDRGEILAGAIKWFQERLAIIKPNQHWRHLAKSILIDKSFAEFANEILSNVGTGVEKLILQSKYLSDGGPSRDELKRALFADSSEGSSTTTIKELPDGLTILELTLKNEVIFHNLRAEHRAPDGEGISFMFPEESEGTQRLAHLLTALYDICFNGSVIVLDEIDRSLHPLLAKNFVREFLNKRKTTEGQLVFTTHETAFLDLGLLRRDEIWFANKPMPAGATELYSLSDYKVRTDLKVDKAYLEGRFDAVPPIELELPDWVTGDMDALRPKR